MNGNYTYNLVIGLSGPYGAGATSLSEELKSILINWPGCAFETVHVVKLIEGYYPYALGEQLEVPETDSSSRRKLLQGAGTKLRQIDLELTGKIITAEISRKAQIWEKNGKTKSIGTTVFIVDCLKNSNEVSFLRKIYGDEFYLIYIHASREKRWRREVDYKGWKENERVEFEERDKVDYNEEIADPKAIKAGQQVGKLSSVADYYIVNNQNRENLKEEARRFLNLLFGDGKNQPTIHERSMHLAYSASNRSYCLSRQVGAAIIDSQGNVLGVGHNDVPKAGGGLYTQEDEENDKRCYLVGDRRCISDVNKEERFRELEKKILEGDFPASANTRVLRKAMEASQFQELTEFCRAVHAEMEVLLSVCRTSYGSTKGTNIYVTTQPCHNCMKHLICAGIHKAVYLEPYPKSLGIELHSDAIEWDPIDDSSLGKKLLLVPYEGVAPHRYHDFFVIQKERKIDGGHYLQRSKLEQAMEPRFAINIYQRSRSDLELENPNPTTAKELICLNEISKFVNDQKKSGLHIGKEDTHGSIHAKG